MKKVQKTKPLSKIFQGINIVFILTIFILNYFYQKNHFDFTLKCICSGGFALLGIINLVYVFLTNQKNKKFYISMATGLFLAMLGDVLIGYNFIIGAAVFAAGHICFFIAYCLLKKFSNIDIAFSAVLFLCAGSFLMFCPLLDFEIPAFKVVCIVYALIISLMLGKAAGNFVSKKSLVYTIMAIASFLFFFSDLMLVLDWFIGIWSWTSEACMGTYYPALCFLALSMFLKAKKNLNIR